MGKMNNNLSAFGVQLEEFLKDIVTEAVEDALNRNTVEKPRYPEKVTVSQASEITGYSRNSLYQMHSKGTIPGAKKVGGKLLFDTVTLRNWVENGGRVITRD